MHWRTSLRFTWFIASGRRIVIGFDTCLCWSRKTIGFAALRKLILTYFLRLLVQPYLFMFFERDLLETLIHTIVYPLFFHYKL